MDILGLTGIHILTIDEYEHDFHIQAESLSSPSCCVHCHHPHLYRHEMKPQLFMDLPIRGKRVGITVQRHRYRCCACRRTFFESLPGMNESHLMTNRLILYIQQEALRRTFVSIADEVGLAESTIRALFSEFAASLQPRIPDTELLYLGIDELYLLRQYRCVITDVANHQIIDLLRERTKATVISYLQRLPTEEAALQCYFAWFARITLDVYEAFLPLTLAIEHYGDAIFNYFSYRYTAGYTESLNGLMKLTQRMGRGYSFEAIRAKVLLTNGLRKTSRPGFRQQRHQADLPPHDTSSPTSDIADQTALAIARPNGSGIPLPPALITSVIVKDGSSKSSGNP